MSTNRDFERTAEAWLAEGPTQLADRVLDAALDEVHLTHQRRRLPVLWRFPQMNDRMRLAATALVVVVVAVAAYAAFGPKRNDVGGPQTTSTPPPSPSPVASSTPSPSDLLDTATWTTYVSNRYGFSIAYPADWVAERADHDWTFPADAVDYLNGGSEHFELKIPNQGIGVNAWSVAVPPGTSLASWIQAYCPKSSTDPCTGLESKTIPATMDGHPGSIMMFDTPQAFFLVDTRIYAVACWQPDNDPTVVKYSGSRRLVEAYLSTMHLLPGGPAPATASPAPS